MLTTLFSRLVLTFGDRSLSYRTVVEELVLGFILVVPFGVFLGHATLRICCWSPALIRADIWNTALRLLIADITMELLLPSIQCLPLYQDVGYSLDLLMQNYGMSCPADTTGRESAALSPTATGIVFAMRLLLVCAGVHIGESFAPIALTGGIACGKSTVARLLTNGGKAEDPNSTSVIHDGSVYLVDTDTIAHEILLPNTPDSVYKQVVEIFGPENILQDNDDDDTDSFLMNEDSPTHIDRRKLGDIIFQNPSKRRQLNSITHPRIILVMLKRMMYGLYLGNKDLVVVDVPLLYESGAFLRRLFCMTILVGCSSETQLDRLQSRNPDLTKQQCQQRIASQMDISQKAKLADIVIWNDSTYEELETQVENTRQAIMNNIYGVGLSLLQLLIIIGGSVPLAVLSKLYTLRANTTQE